MTRRILAILALLCTLTALATADEGMWLFNNPPKEQLKKKYNFNVTAPWLDHLRLGSVRFNNGGSGSFVSADGLTFTNHHVGRACLQQLSTEKSDYIKNGFYARTQADEGKCPDLELNVLVGYRRRNRRGAVRCQARHERRRGRTETAREDVGHREGVRRKRAACAVTSSPSTAAACTTSTSTRNTPTCVSSLPLKRRWRSSAATTITSSIRATTSTSPTSASMNTTSRCISPTILRGRPPEARPAIWSLSPEIPAAPSASSPWPSSTFSKTCRLRS